MFGNYININKVKRNIKLNNKYKTKIMRVSIFLSAILLAKCINNEYVVQNGTFLSEVVGVMLIADTIEFVKKITE